LKIASNFPKNCITIKASLLFSVQSLLLQGFPISLQILSTLLEERSTKADHWRFFLCLADEAKKLSLEGILR
jgi:hypothetical protein